MPKFKCVVREEVSAWVEFEIEALTKEDAAQIAYDKWVVNGEGELSEAVDERWVEVGGETVETEES